MSQIWDTELWNCHGMCSASSPRAMAKVPVYKGAQFTVLFTEYLHYLHKCNVYTFIINELYGQIGKAAMRNFERVANALIDLCKNPEDDHYVMVLLKLYDRFDINYLSKEIHAYFKRVLLLAIKILINSMLKKIFFNLIQ